MKPMLTGFATIKAGKNKSKEIPFKVFLNTPISALDVFAKKVLIEKPFSSDPDVCKGTVRERIGILMGYPNQTSPFDSF
ncbi:MAG: hypothetical protein PHV13_05090 [Candidatus ainarchaeum sp.]|nr:hypothetical protein [Candidatus ainarchaeum sp.]